MNHTQRAHTQGYVATLNYAIGMRGAALVGTLASSWTHFLAADMVAHHGHAVPIVSLGGGFETRHAYTGRDRRLIETDVAHLQEGS